jgi:hypothetical protein
MKGRWSRRRAGLVAITERREQSPERTAAAMLLHRRFPPEERVLPTEFGNAIRSFETHPRARYHLDGIAVWPHIASMLTDAERDDLEESTTYVAFWVNALTLVAVGGTALFVDRLWHRPGGVVETVLVEAAASVTTLSLVWLMYRQAISAAVRWGDPVRAAFDIHRLELYGSLGLRRPTTQKDDEVLGTAVNRLIWFAEPLDDELRSPPGVSAAGGLPGAVSRDGEAPGVDRDAVGSVATSSD